MLQLGFTSVTVTAEDEEGNQFEDTIAVTLIPAAPVTKDSQTVSFGSLVDKTYGAAPFTLSATASSGLPVTFSLAGGPATLAGNVVTVTGAGLVTIRASQPGDATFAAAPDVERTFNVAKATLTITADNKGRAYCAANPTLTASIAGFVNGDTSAVVTGAPALTTSASATSAVGPHPITVAAGTLTAANYTFSFADGMFTVSKAMLTAKAADKTKQEGDSNPPLTISYTGFVNGETAAVIDTPPTASTAAVTGSPAGPYPITLSGGADNNYALTLRNGTLTITTLQVAPTITAPPSDQLVTFGSNGTFNRQYASTPPSPPAPSMRRTSNGSPHSCRKRLTHNSSKPVLREPLCGRTLLKSISGSERLRGIQWVNVADFGRANDFFL